MLKMPESVRIYVATKAVDMRKYADGLSALVLSSLGQEPMSGHVFVFFNRRRDIIRILFWERDGFWVLSKKVLKGHFMMSFGMTKSHQTNKPANPSCS